MAVLELGEGLPVAFAAQDRPDDLQPRLAGHVGDDLAELDVHLRQRLLHVLDVARLIGYEHLPLPCHAAQGAEVALRAERARQQAEAHQLLQPLAVLHVRLAPGDVLHMPGVDQVDREAPRLEKLEQGYPVDAGGLHRHRVHPAFGEPAGQPFEVHGEARELAHRLAVPVRRHCDEVAGSADVDAGGVGVGQFKNRLAF